MDAATHGEHPDGDPMEAPHLMEGGAALPLVSGPGWTQERGTRVVTTLGK